MSEEEQRADSEVRPHSLDDLVAQRLGANVEENVEKRKVLIVEDDKKKRTLFVNALKNTYNTHAASGRNEALSKISSEGIRLYPLRNIWKYVGDSKIRGQRIVERHN